MTGKPPSTPARATHTQRLIAGSPPPVASDIEANDEGKKQPLSARQYLRSMSWVRPALSVLLLYVLGLLLVVALFRHLPPADGENDGELGADRPGSFSLVIPRSMDELRELRAAIEAYHRAHGVQLSTLMVVACVFLQTFMIPGSIFINILAGSMFSFLGAILFVSLVSTAGASLNYWLVRTFLKDVAAALVPGRIAAFQAELRRHNAHLLNYMLFVRVTPVLPHWFVNVASPIVGVPYHVFVLATFVGHQPMNVITVQAGAALSEVKSLQDLYNVRNIAMLMALGAVALVPIIFRQRVRKGARGLPRRNTLLNMLPIIDKSADRDAE